MATKKTTKRAAPKSNVGAEIATAAFAAAAAAGAAGYYFYGTKNAKKHREAAKAWAKGLERDVKKGVKSLKKIDAKTVARVVDDAAAAYQGARGVAQGDVRAAASELKKNWKTIQKEFAPSPKVTKTVKKAVKTVKKAAKTAEATVKRSAKRR